MYFDLLTTFFRIGLFTIGGGYAMIPLIERKVVEEKGWVSEDELMDLMAVAQSCPGIFAINISIFIGYKTRGVRGALLSAAGTALPSFLIILLLALFFQHFRDNVIVEKAFRGIRPAVVALIAAPVFKMGRTAKVNRHTLWIPLVAALLIWLLRVNPIYIIIVAGLGGYVYGRMKGKGATVGGDAQGAGNQGKGSNQGEDEGTGPEEGGEGL